MINFPNITVRFASSRAGSISAGNFKFFVVLLLAVASDASLCLISAQAQSDQAPPATIENSFPASITPGSITPGSLAPIAPLSSPLSGSVRVIDQMSKPMRLKRIETQTPASSAAVDFSAAERSSASAPSGGISDSGLQALFPSKDSFNPPPSLSGFAGAGAAGAGAAFSDQAKTKKKHAYIWNMSLAGGYYDVTDTFHGVVPGNKLYLYGGFMADGHTPVPTGPVPMNHGGHIQWTPTMGAAPED